jgi:DNA (cytosine-5)-methyltransferase 1
MTNIDHSRPTAIDLFCGVGGMSFGFELAGFDVVAAIDNDPINISTYNANFPGSTAFLGDLSSLTGKTIRDIAQLDGKEIDVVFGGPPCQGFSVIGKRSLTDPRNLLLYDFARLVLDLNPKYFVLENVKGLLLGKARDHLENFIECVNHNYNIVKPVRVLNAKHFGVPQSRERVFILGYRKDATALIYPTDGHSLTTPTVWDAIGDLPNVDSINELVKSDTYKGQLAEPKSLYARHMRGLYDMFSKRDLPAVSEISELTGCQRTAHTHEVKQRFEATVPGKIEPISRFYRLTSNGLCNTLRAGSGADRGSFMAARPIHPVYPRVITVREAARLHSFPDNFQFNITKWHGFRQIGNSVPPLLARSVAIQIINTIK